MRNKIDSSEEGGITVCQDFMYSATRKYNKIVGTNSEFKGSAHTVHNIIVAMMATLQTNKKCKQVDIDIDTDDNISDKKQTKRDTPPFMIHWKDTATGI